jgi:hypothetical protein
MAAHDDGRQSRRAFPGKSAVNLRQMMSGASVAINKQVGNQVEKRRLNVQKNFISPGGHAVDE